MPEPGFQGKCKYQLAVLKGYIWWLDRDYLNAQTKLFKLRRSIDLRIEPIIIEQSDDKSGFLEKILETGVEIYTTTVA